MKTFDELLKALSAFSGEDLLEAANPCPPATGPVTNAEANKFLSTWRSTIKNLFGADFSFSNHFIMDRLNSKRNDPQISVCELTFVLNEFFKKFGKQFKEDVENVKNNIAKGRGKNKNQLNRNEFEYVISSRSTGVNFIFALKQNSNQKGTAVMLPMTIMRKKRFAITKGEQVVVEDLDGSAEPTVYDKESYFQVD